MADLFGRSLSVPSRAQTRWWTSVPCSVAVHGLVLAAAVIVPLAATSALPTPASVLAFVIAPPAPQPPEPEIPKLATPAAVPAPATVPLEAPATIAADPDPPVPVTGPPTVLLAVPENATLAHPAAGTTLLAPPPPPPGPVRVGPLVRTPVRIVDVPPVYPAIARQAHVTGTVTIEAVIGVDGRVTDAKVVRSAPLLDQAALAAVRQWRYTPTVLQGTPVAVILTVTVNFVLK